MSLQIGQQLGSYEITSLIGKGGMGEVYRARDTKLKRDVAIKILPEEFSRDADRVSRFQREAESLAALNHQNIAAIHDLQQSDATRFLIMELVEGDTLADILKKRGALPVDEAFQIGKQICEALEAAHEKGIIHRDLKPANVKITPDGKVKVLDFGLAKAFEAEASNLHLSNSPTLSMAATNAGVILGTAAYMSPEQAKGRTVDRRTDIFAFGAVLYEMLTARAAFEGEDVQDLLGAVLKSEPDWTRLPAETPPGIRQLVRLCLQKDAKKRRQTVTDVRIDIEQALTEPAAALRSLPARGARLAWIAFAAALLAAIVLAIPALRYLRQVPPPSLSETRTEINTTATTDPTSFALSPDGRQMVFLASGGGVSRLWLRSLASPTAQPLAGTEGGTYPFWSPDSRSIGFFAESKLKRLDIGGASPQTVASAISGTGGTWNADGVILFASGAGGPLFCAPASGGEAVAATKLDRQTSHRFPFFLPDGRQFLFSARGTPETDGIYLGSLDSAETRRLTPANTAGTYLSSGWLLWVRAGTLVAQRLDLERKALTGDPVSLADPVVFNATYGSSAVSVSAAGLVAYRTGGAARTQLTWFDRAGKRLGVMVAPQDASIASVRISRDGRRAAVQLTVQGNMDIWNLDGTRNTRFTFDAAQDRQPIWSPDGSRIVFQSNRKGQFNLYQKSSGGAGSEELLLESREGKMPTDWSSNGRFILYSSSDNQNDLSDLWVLPVEGDRGKPWPFQKTNFNERDGQFSPDGRWVAYYSNESGRFEIYVRPFVEPASSGVSLDQTDRQWQVSTAGGIFPRWAGDGKELYYIGSTGQMMGVPITAKGATLEPGTPTVLFQTRIVGGGSNTGPSYYDVARDGRFLITEIPDDGAASPITLLSNWKPPAK